VGFASTTAGQHDPWRSCSTTSVAITGRRSKRSSRPGRRWIYLAHRRRSAGVPSTNRSGPCTSS
jgi:hypothetical protein